MIRITGLAVTAALVAACGPDGDTKITGMIDSCATLAAVDATDVIGVPFDAPKSLRDFEGGEETGKMSACGVTSTDPARDGAADIQEQIQNTWFVTLMAWTWPDEESAEAYMDSMRLGGMEGIKPVAVKGLGDEAVWAGLVHARRGNVTISMDVRGPTEEEGEKSEKALETELAARALENLK